MTDLEEVDCPECDGEGWTGGYLPRWSEDGQVVGAGRCQMCGGDRVIVIEVEMGDGPRHDWRGYVLAGVPVAAPGLPRLPRKAARIAAADENEAAA